MNSRGIVYWGIQESAATISEVGVVSARGADGWNLPSETGFWIVLPLVSLWGAVALWRLTVESRRGEM